MKNADCQRLLDELNREMDQLLYAISHDLRAPLRAIDGFSKAVVEDYGNAFDDTGRDYLERVRNGGVTINRYIEGLLTISRESRGELSLESVNISAMAQEVGALVAVRYPEHHPQFTVAKDIQITADRRLARFLLEKLLDNAWKFSTKTAQATIEFGSVTIDGIQTCFVRDNGIGFDMHYAEPRLFGAFQRMHQDEEFAGTGVGLATAKRIINRHGGAIWAESATARGTTLFFRLGGQ